MPRVTRNSQKASEVVKPPKETKELSIENTAIVYKRFNENESMQLINYIHYLIEYRMNELGYEKYSFWDSWIVGVLVGIILGALGFGGGMLIGKHYSNVFF